uniref:GTP_EFTU_D3 domain-containing protein n=1 Tax=Bursaphelenchus xylophilus TaxID=6326 RepID=A0A1I7SDR3_BURXY
MSRLAAIAHQIPSRGLQSQSDDERLRGATIRRYFPDRPIEANDAPLLMPIASSVQITGRGTVVVGTLSQGRLKKGEQVQIKGFDMDSTSVVTDIQVFKKSALQVVAGDHCGILCRGLKASQVRRGMWLGKPGTILTSNVIKANVYLLSPEEDGRKTAIRSGYTERVFCSTWDVSAKLHFKQELLMPGEHIEAEIFFVNDVPIKKNMAFTIREGRTRTVARGVVTDIFEPLAIDPAFRDFNLQTILPKLKSIYS